MDIRRLNLAAATLATLIVCVLAWESAVQHPPAPVLRIGVPYDLGGPTDLMGRLIARPMGETLRQPVIVENVSGRGGMTGAARVASADPDGHLILLGTLGTQAWNQTFNEHPLYDAATDFAPVALIAEMPMVLVVRKDLPVANLREFVAYARKNWRKMTYGSAGAGSASHFACAQLNHAMGTPLIEHEGYGGTAPAMSRLRAGEIDYVCEIITTAKPQIDAGAVKAIALMNEVRSPALPNLATTSEQGIKNVEAYTWNAIVMPKNTPDAIVAKINSAVQQAMHTLSVRAYLEQHGARIVSGYRATPAYLGDFVKSEIDKLASMRWKSQAGSIQFSGISQQYQSWTDIRSATTGGTAFAKPEARSASL